MKKTALIPVIIFVLILISCARQPAGPSPSPTSAATGTHTASPTVSSTFTAEDTVTSTMTVTQTATITQTFTITQTATAVETRFVSDPLGDERTDFTTPSNYDLLQFETTHDATNIYITLTMRDITIASGSMSPQIQIALDRDWIFNNGAQFFPGFADTKVSQNAAWEYCIVTAFGSAAPTVKVFNANFDEITTGSEAIDDSTNKITITVPWPAIGGPPAGALRFTIATYASQSNNLTADIGGTMISNALDVITDVTGITWLEVQDGVVDYYFDLNY